jgi:ribosomal protein S18 acetylase RimI-like enzyme
MIRPFTDADLDAAAVLLAERHRRHVDAEPLLPTEVDFRAEVEALWRSDGASGAAAEGAYVIGSPEAETSWGPNVWIGAAGHAAAQPELVRDLYGAAAVGWLEDGLKAHYALVPATDTALVDAWFRLGFGAQQAHGITEVPEVAWPPGVREATEDDLDELLALLPLLNRHQRQSPVFSARRPPSEGDYREAILEDVERDDVGDLVFELEGRVVGNLIVCPVELEDKHERLTRPSGAAYLAVAITHPGARGSGAGVALTDACFAWALARGYRTMVTDWRVTNLLASRFWPKRGFRTTFLRLHRLIA